MTTISFVCPTCGDRYVPRGATGDLFFCSGGHWGKTPEGGDRYIENHPNVKMIRQVEQTKRIAVSV